LLHKMIHNNIRGMIIDKWNEVEMAVPGTYNVKKSDLYPYVSFIAYTENVENLTLHGFKYPLHHADISWGSTLCISNELFSDVGEYSFDEGILLCIKVEMINNYRCPFNFILDYENKCMRCALLI